LIVPSVFSSFGIFLCRQFVYGIPLELYDAAKIDGAGDFTIYTRIIVGMMKPVISVLAIFSFRATFNDYLWPLVTITDGGNYTLPLALRGIGNSFGWFDYSKVMASSLLTLIPPLIVFFIFQRNLVKGIALTGIKG
ncbi:MAG: carbohydrate ABC transporter permease, partial [Caldilineaceae bacterium SB0675_bin_29]|nr:carbohydrate ABC transporter permease [Caldilineaceae bacterium SB0675_bin_29]